MPKSPDETTDRMFPPPENPNPAKPIPLTPSIREEFLAHRLHFDSELTAIRTELGLALARLSPEADVKSALSRGLAGGSKIGVSVLAILALAQMVVKTWKPEFAGPLEEIAKGIREVIPQ